MSFEFLLIAAAVAMFSSGCGFWGRRRRRSWSIERGDGEINELHERVEALTDQVSDLQERLFETEERLDFAERVLQRGAGVARGA